MENNYIAIKNPVKDHRESRKNVHTVNWTWLLECMGSFEQKIHTGFCQECLLQEL